MVNTNTLDFDTIWSGMQSKFESIEDLALKEDTTFDEAPKAIIERSDVEDLAYREAISIIRKKLDTPVYIFGYDWRKSNADNGKKLHEYVNYLKRKLGQAKFNFVTHSMGGLVFSCFLKELKGTYTVIDRAVLTVCPFKGAPKAMIGLIKGEGGVKVPFFNSNDEFRKIARTFPSVYELCPTYSGSVVFDKSHQLFGKQFDLYNAKHWQSNLLQASHFRPRLSSLRRFRVTQKAMIDLAKTSTNLRNRIVILAGIGEGTDSKVVVKPTAPNGKTTNFFDFDQDQGDGDGTVPIESSSIYMRSVDTLAVKSKWYDKATHGFFLNDGRVQTIIKRFLSGKGNQAGWWSDIGGTVKKL